MVLEAGQLQSRIDVFNIGCAGLTNKNIRAWKEKREEVEYVQVMFSIYGNLFGIGLKPRARIRHAFTREKGRHKR